MANRLAHETSPYLLQHANNPVDWYPWGPEALSRAKAENKPILLSIGYAACHWCHVMEHESFEDAETAALMNQHFINVKVDREERPDLDQIYMSAVQAMTGQGGWPMNVFLTPDGKPFYGGTYYPPRQRLGMPAWQQVLAGVADAWKSRRPQLLNSANDMATHIQNNFVLSGHNYVLDTMLFERTTKKLLEQFDHTNGGFGKAPKFPSSMTLELLLRVSQSAESDPTTVQSALYMTEKTLQHMARGGMYDHIGGGFARYSTDNRWLVPHFEKMLYDNSQLVRIYLHTWQVTGNRFYRDVVEETLDWVLREMTHADGGFYSSLDADSEGVEGKFYVWSAAEIDQLLGSDAPLFKAAYDITPRGNWEHSNIPNTLKSRLPDLAQQFQLRPIDVKQRLDQARQTLYEARAKRVWPGLDDKVLTAWNGMLLAAFAEAGRVLGRADYTAAAVANADFLRRALRVSSGPQQGRLLRTWKAGSAAKYNGYLEDYAYLAEGLLELYQTTFDERWFTWARELADMMLKHFIDQDGGGFFDTSADHETLLFRPKNVQDNATPSANAMACRVLILLSLFTGNSTYADRAEETIAALYPAMTEHPNAFAHWLGCAWLLLNNPREIAIVGERTSADTAALLNVVHERFRPNTIVAVGSAESSIPLLANRQPIGGRATAYVCEQFVCQRPVDNAQSLRKQIDANR